MPVRGSPLGRLVYGLRDKLAPDMPIYPRDLHRFQQALAEIGVTETLARPNTSAKTVLETVKQRLKDVLD